MWRIKDWNDHYENAKSADVAAARWVPVPNKQDGDGYLTLLNGHQDGPAHYGCFMAIVLLASRCGPHGCRGTLRQSNGVAHSIETIARKSHMPPALVDVTLKRCASKEIEWVEWIDDGANACGNLFPEGPAKSESSNRTSAAIESDAQRSLEGADKSSERTSESLSRDAPSARRIRNGNGITAQEESAGFAVAAAAELILKCSGKDETWRPSDELLAGLQNQFPRVNVLQEVKAARDKLDLISDMRKTPRKMADFLRNWMTRAGREITGGGTADKTHEPHAARLSDAIRRREAAKGAA